MAVLMRDVAKRAGVSITTVSHVINNTRPVAENTRTRVLRAINHLSYYTNTSARLLVKGRSNLLGLIISDIENPYFPELIKSFEQASTAQGLETILCATNYTRVQAGNAVRRMLENQVQGVAIMTSQFDEDLIAQLSEKNVPLVLLGSSGAERNRSYIGVDYWTGISDGIAHLLELGHRRIALAVGPQAQTSALEYRQAVEACLRKVRLKPTAVEQADFTPEGGSRAARVLLSAAERPTAIFCGNDRMAMGAIAAAGDLRLQVPGDVSIIGSDDVWMARYCFPPLTTVRVPRDSLGQLAFDALAHMLHSKRRLGVTQTLRTELVIRKSTARARLQYETA